MEMDAAEDARRTLAIGSRGHVDPNDPSSILTENPHRRESHSMVVLRLHHSARMQMLVRVKDGCIVSQRKLPLALSSSHA